MIFLGMELGKNYSRICETRYLAWTRKHMLFQLGEGTSFVSCAEHAKNGAWVFQAYPSCHFPGTFKLSRGCVLA
jgi:hypothetical protein